MLLTEHFNQPCDEYAIELLDKDKKPTGIFYLPILTIKEMLAKDFIRWSDRNFKYSYLQRGFKTYISADLILDLELAGAIPLDKQTGNSQMDELMFREIHQYSFTGTTTFDISKYESENPLENNENFTATANSLCIANACTKIGRKYGMYLSSNRPMDYVPNYEDVKPQKPNVNKAISQILKKQK